MRVEEAVRLLAGIMILLSLALTLWVSQWWLLLTAFVALNLIQSSLSKWCPAITIFRKLGLKS
ncbi:MAG: DUF2892 domain-containing protein [Calditrichaeota bacterium]|nr:DUF2892 domain-containing protein [Calditrichota bacterium]MCB9367193.1 DUF2892 domain-containing protein [Calditrichota bacterium]